MNTKEVVMKLVGSIHPEGDNADYERLRNIKALTELIDALIFEVEITASFADRHEAGMKAIGTHARNFINGLRVYCQTNELVVTPAPDGSTDSDEWTDTMPHGRGLKVTAHLRWSDGKLYQWWDSQHSGMRGCWLVVGTQNAALRCK